MWDLLLPLPDRDRCAPPRLGGAAGKVESLPDLRRVRAALPARRAAFRTHQFDKGKISPLQFAGRVARQSRIETANYSKTGLDTPSLHSGTRPAFFYENEFQDTEGTQFLKCLCPTT